MTSDVILIVRTALRHYAVRRDDVQEIRLVGSLADPLPSDARGRPWVVANLGALLDPADHGARARWHALVVPLRRRAVALLVEQVELLEERVAIEPIPALLREHLRQPWALGALMLDTEVVVYLDLRAVARAVLTSEAQEQ